MSFSSVLSLTDVHENEDFVAKWTLEAPQGIVKESERSWISVVGDLLGPTLEVFIYTLSDFWRSEFIKEWSLILQMIPFPFRTRINS